jgi:hypothetical protein
MALGANRCRFGRLQRLKPNDLGDIAAAFHMGLPRTVTGLASMLVALQECGMRGVGEMLVPNLLMATLADIRVGIAGGLRISR